MLFGITYNYDKNLEPGGAKFRKVSSREDSIAGTGSPSKEEAVENDLMYMLYTWTSWENSNSDQKSKDRIISKVQKEIHQLFELIDTMEIK